MALTASHAQGSFGQVLFEPGASAPIAGNHTFDDDSVAIEFLWESLTRSGRITGQSGIRGTLSEDASRTRESASRNSGEIAMWLTPNMCDFLFRSILGYTISDTSPPLDKWTYSDSLPFFGILIDRDDAAGGGIWEYVDCKCDYWVISASATGGPEPNMVLLRIGVKFCVEIAPTSVDPVPTTWPAEPPALGVAGDDAPYAFSDTSGAIDINGITGVACQSLTMIGRYRLFSRAVNSLTPHSIRPTTHQLQVAVRAPWNLTNRNLYGQAVTGAALGVKFTNGNLSTDFSFINVQAPDRSPNILGKRDVYIEVEGVARSSGSLIVENDHTV